MGGLIVGRWMLDVRFWFFVWIDWLSRTLDGGE